jgi:hypothetical protein
MNYFFTYLHAQQYVALVGFNVPQSGHSQPLAILNG